jgi:hypothetical protein
MLINILAGFFGFKQPRRYSGRHRAVGVLRVMLARRTAA